MVLFLEAETLRLLDLYVALRAEPRNVTNNGVMLRQSAREQLTSALNASFPRETPWTEGQVSVKFKNLRSEYAEFKWLSAQPGFRADGAGMSDDWWRAVKIRRSKCHAFKGKLPWIFESRMRLILGDGERQQVVKVQAQPEQQDQEKDREQDGNQELVVREQDAEQQVEEEEEEEGEEEEEEEEAPLLPVESPLRPQHKRKRDDSERDSPRQHRESGDWEQNSTTTPSYGHGRSLAKSVEQSAVAAAGMARGFQDLIAMFQEEATRCRALEQQATRDDRTHPSLADQRSVLLAIAHSLDHSTRATADMAKGYRELVSAFVREADVQRPRHPEPEL